MPENKILKFDVQIGSVYSSGGGESTIKFGCSSETLSELESFADKEKLLKFTLTGADDEEMYGYIANVHSTYGGKLPRYFTVKLDSQQRMKAGQLLALTGQEVNINIEIPPEK